MTALRDTAAYAAALADLMPRGAAWPEGGGPVWGQLMTGLAGEMRRADARALRLIEEADPRTCGETLPDYERVLALPDPCTPGDATFEERRNAVIAKLRSLGGASRAYFIALAADLGYQITITEHRPFVCGLSACGEDPLMVADAGFVWTVTLAEQRVLPFRAGESRLGEDRLTDFGRATDLECVFNRLKPAHTTVVFDYSETSEDI